MAAIAVHANLIQHIYIVGSPQNENNRNLTHVVETVTLFLTWKAKGDV